MTDISLDRQALVLFEALLEAAPENRDRWLAERIAGRPDLLARVRTLLAADERTSLRTGGAVEAVEEVPAPDRLGGYRIGERIGAGGMGSVFRATRDRGDFEHLAAVKIIKPGLLSQRLVDRFRRERQILAQLRHPNIAQLFDGGETEDGSPYIIMEYVEGQSLLEWAEKAEAPSADRIDKLLQACAAVSFAHANLIVHRDITPSNVLVTAGGVLKLIDFGIARPAAPMSDTFAATSSSSSSLQTLSLTPGYAAPERMTGAEPTTAADIYSLGKLAQKLLETSGADRELAAIIAKATARQPQDRYGTVDQFATDLTAWRDSRPVSAFAGGGGYVLGKFVARHRRAAFAAGGVLLLLLTAFAGTGLAWFRADRAREAEARRFEDVRALANYLLFDLNEQLRSTPGNTAARADLAAKAQTYLDTLSNSRDASRALRLETARGLIRLAEIQDSPLDRNLGQTESARQNLERARTLLTDIKTEFGDAADLAVTEARVEAIAGMIAFYEDTDAEASLALLNNGKAALERVAPASRDADWRIAQRDISRAEMERHSANEEFEELVVAADQHDALVNSWPQVEQGQDAAAVEHAYASYNRGLAWSLMEREAEGYPAMRTAHDVFAAAEGKSPGNPALLYMIGWSGADAYAAAARLEKATEAEDLLVSAQRAARRLVEIEDRDESARVLNVMVGEAYSQHLGNTGRFEEAIAEQRRIVDAKIAEMDETSSGADAGWSEMLLGLIAKQAGRRTLTCESWTSAERRFSKAEAAGRLVAFHAAFLPGLRANLDLCRKGAPISAFVPLR
jgi:eukaryotic-like serine/threonine-protein kinase